MMLFVDAVDSTSQRVARYAVAAADDTEAAHDVFDAAWEHLLKRGKFDKLLYTPV